MTDDLTDLSEPPLDLATEIRGMRSDFRGGFAKLERERVGRRGTNRLAVIIVIAVLVVLAVLGGAYVQQGRVTCETRIASREDTRAGIAAAADEVASFAAVPDEDRAELNRRVAARVRAELPNPC